MARQARGLAVTVASGGASFANGMLILLDTSTLAEVVTMNGIAYG